MKTQTVIPEVLDYPTSSVNTIDLRIDKKEFQILTEDGLCIIDEVEFVKIIDLETKMPLPVVAAPQPTTTATPRKGMSKFLSRLLNRLAVLPLTLPLCLILMLGVGNVWGQAISFTGTTYTQDFQSMTGTTTANAASLTGGGTMVAISGLTGGGPTGWYTYMINATGNRWLSSDLGSSNAGGFRQLIDNNSTRGRAFGSQGSGSATGSFGLVLQNTSGSTINSVSISYDAVMNRNPSTTANSYPMSYRVSSTNIVTTASTGGGTFAGAAGTWTSGTGFTTPSSSTGAPNATQAAISPLFRIGGAAITQTLNSLNWGNNEYLYIRWSEADESGSDATAGVDNFSISIPSSIVTFNGNGSTAGSMSNQTASVSTSLTTNAFTRTGYTFAGWNTAANGSGTAYANGASYPFTSSTTLYAQWTANSNTITFDGNGATGGATASQNINTAASANLTANGFTRAGYTFAGWNAASNGTGTSFADQASFTMGTTNVTLYAQWSANILSVNYDSQGGSTISNGSTSTGGTVSNPGNPTRSGYSFNGWFVASSGGSAISFPYTHGQTSSFILYAQWTVVASPTIDPVTLSSAISTTYGTASTEVSFIASGSNLNSNITATAESGYQVSDDNSTFGSSVSVSSGTSLYVRFTAGQSAGTYNNATAVVLTSTGATLQNVTTSSSGNTVSQKGLTIAGISISNKTYDATTAATISGTAAYSGLVNGESFSVTGSPSAVFNNKNVGTAKPITVSGYTAPSGNYSISQPTGLTADITAKALTVTSPAVTSKTYDGTTNATISGSLSGVESGDAVTLIGTGTFASANVGTGINVTSTSSLGGADAGNYSLTQPIGMTGEITKANQTITFGALTNKTTNDTPFNLNATASSGLTVSYSSSNTSVASIVDNTVTIVGVGTTTITASQSGNSNYNAATDFAQSLTVTLPDIEEIIFPKYIQGVNGTNSNRIPGAFYLKINNLNANTTYRFYCGLVLPTDASTSSGAGNNIFVNYAGGSFTRATGTSMSAAGQYSTLTSDANGSYTGWFIIEPTGNATRYVPGNNLLFRVTLNDGNNGTIAVNYRTSTNTTKVINLVASSGANNGTGLYGASSSGSKNFAVLYDNTAGTGRPISASFIEDDGTANTTANSYSNFYGTNVNGVSGAFGVVIPNDNSNGIKRIEFKKTSDNSLIYSVTDNDGNWNSSANTVNPTGGTTAISIPNSNFDDAYVNESAGVTLSQNTTINGTLNLTSGTLTVGANTLTINGSISRTSGNIDASNALATVVFGGSTAQTIPASTFTGNINNMTLNNSAGLSMQQAITISNSLNLTNGILTIGNNNLTLSGSLHESNNGSSTAFINTNGSGAFIRSISTTGVDYKFPIGITNYAPITVNFTGGTISSSTLASRAVSGLHPNADPGAYIHTNLYWEMNQTGMTNPQYNVSFTYPGVTNGVGSSETEVNLLPAKWSASTGWLSSGDCAVCFSGNKMGTASINTSTKRITWNGVSGFSDFGGFGEGNGSPLPVELLSFNASCVEDQNVLSWQTASEHNSSHFDIEKSRDGETWDVIGQQVAAGNSNVLLTYQFVDEEKNTGTVYYRLNQFDMDGKNEYFGPVALACEQNSFEASTLPNPSAEDFWLRIQTENNESVSLKIKDINGAVIHGEEFTIMKGINMFPIRKHLIPGIYLIDVKTNKGNHSVIKHLRY